MKILHLIPGLSNASGPTQVVYYLAHQALENGHDVSVAYIKGRGTEPVHQFAEKIKVLGFLARGPKKYGYAPGLRTFFRKHGHEFDVIHTHSLWVYTNWAAYSNWRKWNTPYIVRPAGTLEPWALGVSAFLKKTYYFLIEKRILNNAVAIHATSSRESENIRRHYLKSPVFEIPNGIDSLTFSKRSSKAESRKTWQLPEDQFILLFMGRIHPVKNLEFIARLVQRLIQTGTPVFFAIAGPDQHTYANKVKTYFEETGIMAHCRFLGEVQSDQKGDLYQLADAFVLSSFSENFGVVIAEALASGLPVLASQNTPWQNIETTGAGYWLPLEEEQWITAIQELVLTAGKRQDMSIQAQKLGQQFDWGRISERMIDMYRQVIKR